MHQSNPFNPIDIILVFEKIIKPIDICWKDTTIEIEKYYPYVEKIQLLCWKDNKKVIDSSRKYTNIDIKKYYRYVSKDTMI